MDKLQHKHHTFRSVFDKEDPTYKEVSETTFRESYVMPDQNIRLDDAAKNKDHSGSLSSSNHQVAVNDQDGSVGSRSSSSSSNDSELNERHHRKLKKKGGLQDNVSQYGNVFPVKTKMLGREFMCKIIKITAMTKERDYKKHLIPQMVHHKNIIVIHDALIVKQDKLIDKKYFAIIMEKCQYNLQDFMLQLSQDQDYKENLDMRLDIIDQLLEVMAFLHERNIVHLGLKPENILLDEDGTVKLADFGDYTEFDDKGYDKVHKVKKLKHKVKHMFKHTVRGEDVNSIFYYKRQDIYRLGAIILVIALYPKIDFNEKFLDFEDLKFSEKKILEVVDYEVKDPTLRELLPNMLQQKTKNRLNMKELLKIWKHNNVSRVGKVEQFFKKHIKREKIKKHEELGFEDANIKQHNVEPHNKISYQNQNQVQNQNQNVY